jgi:tRNA1(Val) A37 N6-methylase TrmN6
VSPEEDVREDTLLGGRVRILQPLRGHRAGTDAVLLAAAAPVRDGDAVVDVGAGVGSVALMLTARAAVRPTLIEIDPALAALASRNLALNGRAGAVLTLDIMDRQTWPERGLIPESADVVATNPPFLEAGQGRASPDAARAAAHVLPAGGLERWLAACGALLRPGGRIALVQRADRLEACLQGLPRGLGEVRLRFVHPREGEPASRLLLIARKGSRAPLTVGPPLVLHEAGGRFTAAALALHGGEATLT